MKYIFLFYAILRKDLIYQWRYKVNTFVGILFLTFICFGIIFGINSFSEKGMDTSEKAGFIGGYILWLVMMTSYQTITRTITSESTLGTFEQLYINSPNIFTFLFMKCFSAFLTSMITIYFIIFLILYLANIPLDMNIVLMLPVILIGIPALWAMSLGIGSLALVAKQIDAVSSVVSMIVLASIPIIVQKSQLAAIVLPFGLSNKLSQDIFTGTTSLSAVSVQNVAAILANDAVYLAIGMTIFKISEYYAKKYGKLAHH
jgi:ABC-type transport system involved in cytochrome c biogenesis permease component